MYGNVALKPLEYLQRLKALEAFYVHRYDDVEKNGAQRIVVKLLIE